MLGEGGGGGGVGANRGQCRRVNDLTLPDSSSSPTTTTAAECAKLPDSGRPCTATACSDSVLPLTRPARSMRPSASRWAGAYVPSSNCRALHQGVGCQEGVGLRRG